MVEELLEEALGYEQQAQHERNPSVIRFLLKMRDIALDDALDEERKVLNGC
jgi:hypothetical protein